LKIAARNLPKTGIIKDRTDINDKIFRENINVFIDYIEG